MKRFTSLLKGSLSCQICCLFLVFMLSSIQSKAQDVAFCGIDGAGGDEFSFVLLRDFSAGDVLYITEDEYVDATNSFNSTEGHIRYTVPVGGLTENTVVTITESSSNTFMVGGGGGTAVIVGTGTWSISLSDELYAYEASDAMNPWSSVTDVHCFFWTDMDPINTGQEISGDWPNSITIAFNVGGAAGITADFNNAARVNTTVAMLLDAANWTTSLVDRTLSTTNFTDHMLSGGSLECPDALMIEGCGTADIMPTSSLGFSASSTTITSAQFLAEGGMLTSGTIMDVSYMDVASGTCPITVARTYTVVDNMGSTLTCVQAIMIDDSANPMITSCPTSPATIEGCNTDAMSSATTLPFSPASTLINPTQFATEGGAATDVCGVLSINYIDEAAMGICPLTITRTFTVADACGNAATCTQTFVIDDTGNPIISTCPVNQMLNGCVNENVDLSSVSDLPYSATSTTVTEVAFLGEGGVVDEDCNFSISYVDMLATGDCTGGVIRTYTVSDICSNTATCVQSFMIVDNVAPMINCPMGQRVEGCMPADIGGGENEVPAYSTTMATITPLQFMAQGGTITEDCDDFTITYIDVANTDDPCNIIVTRTYTVTDACMNSASCDQEFAIVDTTIPTISNCPTTLSDGVVGFTCMNATPDYSVFVTTADNCGGPVTVMQTPPTGTQLGVGMFTITLIAIDQCGNESEPCTFILNNTDIFDPELTCPSEITVEGCSVGDITNGGMTSLDFSATPVTIMESQFTTEGGMVDENCSLQSLTYQDEIFGECDQVVTRTYTATDASGNTGTCQQTININDRTGPTMSCGAITVELVNGTYSLTQMDINMLGMGSMDDCGAVTLSGELSTYGCDDLGEQMVTITGTDPCDNSAMCMATVTVTDPNSFCCQAPTIACPADNFGLPMGCNVMPPAAATTFNTDGTTPDPALPTVMDGCLPLTLTSMDQMTEMNCTRTITRTYMISDANSNTDVCTQTFTINIDTEMPTFINPPMSVTAECDQIPDPPMLMAMDNCPGAVMVSLNASQTPGSCPQEFIITRVWTATDACMNTATHTQMITVEDNTPPTFTVPGPVTLTCTDDPTDLTLTGDVEDAMDACDMGGSSTPTEIWINEIHYDNVSTDAGEFVEIAGTAGLDLSTYSIVLYNGNGGASYNTVALSGTIDDEGTGFGALSFAISGIQNGAPDGLALVKDGTLVIEFLSYEGSFTASNGPANGTTSTNIGVSETGTTPVGQSVQLTGTGSMSSDFTWSSPSAESPGTLNMGQTTVAPPPVEGLAIDFVDSAMPTCGGLLSTITRTWTVTDACNNVATQTQIITIADDVPPTFMVPATATIECSDNPDDLTLTGNVSNIMDNCDPNPVVTYSDVVNLTGCGGYTGTITRTWTVTDACGNPTSQTQIINVQDTTDPTFTVPANLTVECLDDATDLTITGEVEDEADNCSGASLMTAWINEFHYDNTSSDVGEFIEVAGTAGTDLSTYSIVLYNGANGMTYNSAIALSGTIADESNGFGAASFPIPGLQNGSPDGFALVQNGTIVISFLSYEGSFMATNGPAMGMMSTDVGPSEPGTTLVGQSLQLTGTGSAAADFTWSGPAAESPASLNVGQTMVALPPVTSIVTVTFSDMNAATACDGGTITRTWTAIDACGNDLVQTQTITVSAPAGPQFECPADMTVECEDEIMISEDDIDVTTACGLGFEVILRGPEIYGTPGCTGSVYEFSYSVIDDCGRVATCTRYFTIQNAVPTITCPADATVECREDIVVNANNASFTTSCDLGLISRTVSGPVLNGPDGCPGTTYTFTYRVLDVCGRAATCEQVFTIGNNDGPTISCPASQTIACASSINVNPAFAVVETSCGSDFEVSVSEPVVSGTPDCPGATYTYVYTVEDACGRTASCSRVFTIANEGPILDCPDNYLFLNCEDFSNDGLQAKIQAWLGTVSATSSCYIPLGVTNNYSPNSLGLCSSNPFTDITFFATDQCGRTSTCTGTIVIADTEAPNIKQDAQDASADCYNNFQGEFQAWLSIQGGAAALDECWGDVTWSTIPSFPTISCNGGSGSTTVTFVATDGCGNFATTTATFSVSAGGLDAPGGDQGVQIENDQTSFTDQQAPDHLTLFQNSPNPFKQETTIRFYLPESGLAILTVYDVAGRTLKQVKGDYTQGYNEVVIDRSELSAAGVLYYRLNTEKEMATKTMILVD